MGQRPLGRRVTGRDRQPEHVTQGACTAAGDLLAGGQQGRTQDRFGRDHTADRLQLPGVVGQVRALEDEAVEIAPGKADLDADSGLDLVSQIGRHEVVEGTIQVGQAGVDLDPRDRI